MDPKKLKYAESYAKHEYNVVRDRKEEVMMKMKEMNKHKERIRNRGLAGHKVLQLFSIFLLSRIVSSIFSI